MTMVLPYMSFWGRYRVRKSVSSTPPPASQLQMTIASMATLSSLNIRKARSSWNPNPCFDLSSKLPNVLRKILLSLNQPLIYDTVDLLNDKVAMIICDNATSQSSGIVYHRQWDPLIPEYHQIAERSRHYYSLCYEPGDPTVYPPRFR